MISLCSHVFAGGGSAVFTFYMYKKKGTVVSVTQKTVHISVSGRENPAYVDVHEDQLEAVIPAAGRDVLVLSGKHPGCTATGAEKYWRRQVHGQGIVDRWSCAW